MTSGVFPAVLPLLFDWFIISPLIGRAAVPVCDGCVHTVRDRAVHDRQLYARTAVGSVNQDTGKQTSTS